MLPWKNLIQFDRNAPKSVYLQIAEGIINAIRSGYLQAGQRLPGSRQMADLLEVNRKTSLLAYDELVAQGWIITQSSRGTFVADTLPIIRPTALENTDPTQSEAAGFSWHIPEFLQPPISFSFPLSFDDGLPDIRLAPIEELARAHSRNLRRLWDQRQLSYQDALGYVQLRAQLAQELNATRGLNIGPDHIMITRGSQMAIFLAAR
ncbi:MAG: GntR family transcriptional regulator, partial [Lewinella sp.]|nr:GntR family transcriptional regulator [Lewinella sp.]